MSVGACEKTWRWSVQVGDLVKFVDVTGSFPGIDGNIALIAEQDEWATIIEWPDGTRDDIAYYADYCPFSPQEAWLEVISAGR